MLKYKCTKCEHQADEKGFCPKDGAELLASEGAVDSQVKSLLEKIGVLVQEKTAETLKEYGLEKKGPGKAIYPSAGSKLSKEQKLEFVKGLMERDAEGGKIADLAHFEDLVDEKEKRDFLRKAKIAYFFKHLVAFQVTHDPAHLEVVKALAEGTDAVGGYLTPTEFRAELVRDLKDKPLLRNLVTVIPMTSDNLELPTLTSDVKTSWGSENTTISTTTARFGTLTFAPKRLNTFLYTSRELVADSAINVVQFITTLFIEAIGAEEDRVIVNGSGSGQPKGILQETLAGIDNGNDDTTLAPNIKKLPFRLGTGYRRNARWLVNSKTAEAISALRDSNNQFLLRNLEGKGLEDATLAGYPVHEQNDMPLDTLLFGDLKQYYLADREQVSVETTTEGAGTFEKHQVAIKVVERLDGKVAQTLGFRTLTNAGID